MGKKELYCEDIDQKLQKDKERVEAVLQLLRKQAPLTIKQEKYCSYGCVERFLKGKAGENVKKAAKQLRACLSWRESIGIDNLTADEFSAELADGVAFVSGYDNEARPVLIFRIKQDYHKFHSHKQFTRLVVFTLEVAIQSIAKNVEQSVSILFDASFYRSASAFMNMFLATLKIISEYYPAHLHKAFVIDPPSLFSYLWKGVKAFVELSPLVMVVSSHDLEESMELEDMASYPRASSSLRFNASSLPSSNAKIGSCSSSRFSFTVSHHFDSVKPWYLSLTDTSASKVGPTNPSLVGPALISPANARSFSFASPIDGVPRGKINTVGRKSFFPSTPLPQKTQTLDYTSIKQPRTPKPSSFLHSPAMFFKRDCHVSKANKCRESFAKYLKFYRRPYDEMTYRSKMRAPLGGLVSIVSPQVRRRHMSVSQRF